MSKKDELNENFSTIQEVSSKEQILESLEISPPEVPKKIFLFLRNSVMLLWNLVIYF